MRLIDMQRDFRDWLRTEDAGARARLGGGSGPAVYLNNHRAALMESLRASYSQTARWIGGDAFETAAARYIDAHAPSHWTLDAYGEQFAPLLSNMYPDDREVGDLARIEWALGEAFVAPDAQPLVPAQIAGINWDRAVLRLIPSARLLDLSTNADALHSALATEAVLFPPVEALSGSCLLIWRSHFTVSHRRIANDEADCLRHIRHGLPFLTLCETLTSIHGPDDGIHHAGTWLAHWTREGLLAE